MANAIFCKRWLLFVLITLCFSNVSFSQTESNQTTSSEYDQENMTPMTNEVTSVAEHVIGTSDIIIIFSVFIFASIVALIVVCCRRYHLRFRQTDVRMEPDE